LFRLKGKPSSIETKMGKIKWEILGCLTCC